MVRLLVLVAIAIVVVLLLRRLFAKGSPADKPAGGPDASSEAKLVRCVECGAFVPKADAVAVTNGFRCGAGCNVNR
jgi:hypothetical protein